MEERAVGGKEKKYVLYTVVNDDKGKAGVSVWVVRILLGSLLMVALAVVPYVSLRLAQVNDRTLVVFQPVPIHNHSRGHHHHDIHGSSHAVESHRPGGISVSHVLQSSSLVRENYTTESPKEKKTKISTNATLVTLHESAVTLSFLEDTNNVTHSLDNHTAEAVLEVENSNVVTVEGGNYSNITSFPVLFDIEGNGTKKERDMESSPEVIENSEVPSPKNVSLEKTSVNGSIIGDGIDVIPSPSTHVEQKDEPVLNVSISPIVERTSKLVKILRSSTTTTTTVGPSTKDTSTMSTISHKLAYVATASSGNHVGGICIWKINKNVTKWSYFYDNIPIEFQSHQDSTDHEMRGLLAAVRLWYKDWHDYHVVVRSHHTVIKSFKHPMRLQLTKELDEKSDKHFTYELEWRLRKDDRIVSIAYCLAKLHKDYNHWFKEFQGKVDELLGVQNWEVSKVANRMQIPQDFFITATRPEIDEDKIGDFTSIY